MMETVAERSKGVAGAFSAPEVNRRNPFARLGMGDREAARPEQADGGIYVGVSHGYRRLGALNHAIDSPRKGRREWRRRLRQLLRLRRKRISFFIEFFCRFAGVGCPPAVVV